VSAPAARCPRLETVFESIAFDSGAAGRLPEQPDTRSVNTATHAHARSNRAEMAMIIVRDN
jgi:hypothetical protein